MTREELLNSLSPELREKAKSCKTSEDLEAFFAENGMPLNDDVLDAVSGGSGCYGYGGCDEHTSPPPTHGGKFHVLF